MITDEDDGRTSLVIIISSDDPRSGVEFAVGLQCRTASNVSAQFQPAQQETCATPPLEVARDLLGLENLIVLLKTQESLATSHKWASLSRTIITLNNQSSMHICPDWMHNIMGALKMQK